MAQLHQTHPKEVQKSCPWQVAVFHLGLFCENLTVVVHLWPASSRRGCDFLLRQKVTKNRLSPKWAFFLCLRAMLTRIWIGWRKHQDPAARIWSVVICIIDTLLSCKLSINASHVRSNNAAVCTIDCFDTAIEFNCLPGSRVLDVLGGPSLATIKI